MAKIRLTTKTLASGDTLSLVYLPDDDYYGILDHEGGDVMTYDTEALAREAYDRVVDTATLWTTFGWKGMRPMSNTEQEVVRCVRCHGRGRYLYSTGATWDTADTYAEQSMTEDICDLCWGSGTDRPWRNLDKMVQRLRDLTAEVETLQKDKEKLLSLSINSLAPDEEGAMVAELQHCIIPLMAKALSKTFVESGGVNYVEFRGDDQLGPLQVMIQRRYGKTPAQINGELRAELATLKAQVERTCEWTPDRYYSNLRSSCGDVFWGRRIAERHYCPNCGGKITEREG